MATDINNEDKIQTVINETNTKSDSQITDIQKKFDDLMKSVSGTTEAVDNASKNVLNFTGKVVRVELIDTNGIVQKSYLDQFELDPTSALFRSKYETVMSFELVGICLSLTETSCKSSSLIPEIFKKFSTEQAGRFNATPEAEEKIKAMPAFPFSKITQVEKIESDALYVSLKNDFGLLTGPADQNQIISVKISIVRPLSKLKHNFAKLTEDKSDRHDSKQVDSSLKSLSDSVAQIYIDEASGSSMLNGSGSSHGTGFFISKDGLFMTNNHVIRGDASCIKNMKCSFNIKQIDRNDIERHFTVNAKLLITNEQMDFAILKIDLPSDIQITTLELDTEEVDADLMTLGFPGDKLDKTRDSRDGVFLTYSFGKLVSMMDLAYVTSNYIAGGASGSPLLNLKNKKLVAILSNGNSPRPDEDGSPGLARPIQMINAKFDIDGYLTGKKQERVITILQMLKVSTTAEDANKALNIFDLENTYLGLPTLKNIMLEHNSGEIRVLIKKYLEQKDYLLGSEEE